MAHNSKIRQFVSKAGQFVAGLPGYFRSLFKPCIMKKTIILYMLFPFVLGLHAQTRITGQVTDASGQAVPGANVYLKGSFDGASTDADGRFGFETRLAGRQILVTSMMGFKTRETMLELTPGHFDFSIRLSEAYNSLEAVTIAAGTFEASDVRKAVVLKPLDIVTTASSAGDIYGALRTLPGAQQVGEDGRLFVRGGEASETRTYMDGMLIKNPYSSQVPDVPARGRFSPMIFTGTVFSTGGYSAEFGQAMSSALILKTGGLAEKTESGLSVMTVGGSLSHTRRSTSGSVSASIDYYNLAPYFAAFRQNMDYDMSPKGFSGVVMHRHARPGGGMWKTFASAEAGELGLQYPDFDHPGQSIPFRMKNRNFYANSQYTGSLSPSLTYTTGLAADIRHDDKRPGNLQLDEKDRFFQAKATITKEFSPQYRLKAGAEGILQQNDFRYSDPDATFDTLLVDKQAAAFAETELSPSNGLAIRVGLRTEYSGILNKQNLAPRSSLSLRTSANSQISLAGGRFYQNPELEILRRAGQLTFEYADHYILNFQWAANDRVFRAEVYHKNYRNLIRQSSDAGGEPDTYSNTGHGFAKGLDIFWRDQKTIRGLDYWVSYSYTDTRRLYRDFPVEATPAFISTHNLSVVGKYWVDALSTQFGLTASFASGRPYHNPNSPGFMDGKTRPYYDLSMNASYLTELFGQFAIIHLSVSNLPGTEQVFGYHFSSRPGADGIYQSFAITPPAPRFIFLGVFITLDHRKKA